MIRHYYFRQKLLVNIIRTILGTVFVVTGFSKLFPLSDFLRQLVAYHLPFTSEFLSGATILLIIIEIIIGLFILLDFQLYWGLLGMQVLLLIMIPVTIWGSINKAPSCGCYGNLVQREPWQATIEALLIFAIGVLLQRLTRKESNLVKSQETYKAIAITVNVLAALLMGWQQL